MEKVPPSSGSSSAPAGPGGPQQPGPVWRPWTGDAADAGARNARSVPGGFAPEQHLKAPQVVHPVKLFWPKSRCFDYLYRDAETLLRNYPAQATICLYEDSSGDEDSDDEEEETQEKQLN